MHIDIALEHRLRQTPRVKQFLAMFDVPAVNSLTVRLQGELPIEDRPWHVGLIVGPSGCGKSTILRHYFGEPLDLHWQADAVVDDFAPHLTIREIAAVCQAVGFNTIPAWLRPYRILSNGEKFRAEVARRLIETPPDQVIAIDEFTSVVHRRVARITSWAVQKWVRRQGRRLVAASCHDDLVDWLQPDWILEPGANMTCTIAEPGRPARPVSWRKCRDLRGGLERQI